MVLLHCMVVIGGKLYLNIWSTVHTERSDGALTLIFALSDNFWWIKCIFNSRWRTSFDKPFSYARSCAVRTVWKRTSNTSLQIVTFSKSTPQTRYCVDYYSNHSSTVNVNKHNDWTYFLEACHRVQFTHSEPVFKELHHCPPYGKLVMLHKRVACF